MKKLVFFAMFFSFFAIPAFAGDEDDEEYSQTQDIILIDIPTSSTLDKYSFRFGSRLYSEGGTHVRLGFGIHDRLTLGTSFLVDGLIGNGSHVRMRTPEIELKLRFWDGNENIPSLALGYDGQGQFYDGDMKEYMEEKRGIYLVSSYELLSSFFLNGGINVPDFDNGHVFGFAGISWKIMDQEEREIFTIMAEYDNVFHHSSSYERLNAGIRFPVTPEFTVDLDIRDINYSGTYKNGMKRYSERVLQLNYTAKF